MKKIKDQYKINISEEDFDLGRIRKTHSLESNKTQMIVTTITTFFNAFCFFSSLLRGSTAL